YFPGTIDLRTVPMSWMDRSGKLTSLRETRGSWTNPAFAPDGGRLAFDAFANGQTDIWVYAWQRDTLSQVTADSGDSIRAVWTPGGHGIALASRRGGSAAFNLFSLAVESPNDATRLTDSKNNQYPTSWHPSGRFLAFDEDDPSQPQVPGESSLNQR